MVSWLGWRWAGQLGRDGDDAAVPSMAWLDRSVAPFLPLAHSFLSHTGITLPTDGGTNGKGRYQHQRTEKQHPHPIHPSPPSHTDDA